MVDHRNDQGIRGEYFAFVSCQPPAESDFSLKLYWILYYTHLKETAICPQKKNRKWLQAEVLQTRLVWMLRRWLFTKNGVLEWRINSTKFICGQHVVALLSSGFGMNSVLGGFTPASSCSVKFCWLAKGAWCLLAFPPLLVCFQVKIWPIKEHFRNYISRYIWPMMWMFLSKLRTTSWLWSGSNKTSDVEAPLNKVAHRSLPQGADVWLMPPHIIRKPRAVATWLN